MAESRIARLHGGQVAILMVGLAVMGYGLMALTAPSIWNVGNQALGIRVSGSLIAVFSAGIALIMGSHLLGRTWARGRTLSPLPSLGVSLWLPAVGTVWAYRAYTEAAADAQRYRASPPMPDLDSLPPGRAAMELAYAGVASTYLLMLLAASVLAILLLFRWFGRLRTPTPAVTPAPHS